MNASEFSLRIFTKEEWKEFSSREFLNVSIISPLYPLSSVPAAEMNSGHIRVDTTLFSDLDPSHKTLVVC